MLGVAVGYPRFQILPAGFPVPPLWAFGLSCFLFLRESPRFAVSSAFPPSIPTGGWLVQGPGVGERGVLQRAPVSQASEPVSGVPLALSRSTGLFLPSPLTVFLAVTFPVSFLKLPPLLTMACNRPLEHSGQPTISLP